MAESGVGGIGNNRYEVVISNQIEIMIIAAMETIARTEGKNVEDKENDMGLKIHKLPKRSQVAGLTLTSRGERMSPL